MLPWGGLGPCIPLGAQLHPRYCRRARGPTTVPLGTGCWRTLDLPDPTTAKSCSESVGELPASPGNVRSTQQKSARPMPSFPLL